MHRSEAISLGQLDKMPQQHSHIVFFCLHLTLMHSEQPQLNCAIGQLHTVFIIQTVGTKWSLQSD